LNFQARLGYLRKLFRDCFVRQHFSHHFFNIGTTATTTPPL
jgi:hypothetical protein